MLKFKLYTQLSLKEACTHRHTFIHKKVVLKKKIEIRKIDFHTGLQVAEKMNYSNLSYVSDFSLCPPGGSVISV